jgi:hypothetical protein
MFDSLSAFMAKLAIELEVPEGTTISIRGLEEVVAGERDPAETMKRYWREYLSDNGRRIYGAAARLEDLRGSFTLEDIARVLSVTYESARSMHRTTGRSARKWRNETSTKEPIRLEWIDYAWDPEHNGDRTVYRLPRGVAEVIRTL